MNIFKLKLNVVFVAYLPYRKVYIFARIKCNKYEKYQRKGTSNSFTGGKTSFESAWEITTALYILKGEAVVLLRLRP